MTTSIDSTPTASPVALISGAGSGVGQALAQQLAAHGYDLTLIGRRQAALDQTVELIQNHQAKASNPASSEGTSTNILVLAEDLTDPDSPQAIVDATMDYFGRIDALCNVAGSAPLQPIQDINADLFDDCIAINLKAPALLASACWPVFTLQKSGTIASISSMASVDPFEGFNLYGAAKSGLNLLTKALADEGQKIGVKTVSVAPGAIETAMLRSLFPTSMLPEDQCLSPEQVAQVITDCLTQKRDFESGETILLPSP